MDRWNYSFWWVIVLTSGCQDRRKSISIAGVHTISINYIPYRTNQYSTHYSEILPSCFHFWCKTTGVIKTNFQVYKASVPFLLKAWVKQHILLRIARLDGWFILKYEQSSRHNSILNPDTNLFLWKWMNIPWPNQEALPQMEYDNL